MKEEAQKLTLKANKPVLAEVENQDSKVIAIKICLTLKYSSQPTSQNLKYIKTKNTAHFFAIISLLTYQK